jgi:hypothetical protein
VTRTRPGRASGYAVFVLGGVRYVVRVSREQVPLTGAAERLRTRLRDSLDANLTGAAAPLDGVAPAGALAGHLRLGTDNGWYAVRVLGAVDGFVYGGMVGLGYQVVENIAYATSAVEAAGTGDRVEPVFGVFVARGFLAGPWSYTAFTALAGAGVGYAVVRVDRSWSARLREGDYYSRCCRVWATGAW